MILSKSTIIWYGIAILTCLLLIAYYSYYTKKKNRIYKQIRGKRKKNNYLQPIFVYFTRSRLFRKSFEKTRRRIQMIYPADMSEVNERATRYTFLGLLVAGSVMAVVLLTSGGDLFYICSGLVITYIIYSQVITIRFELMENNLLNQLVDFLTDVRNNYYKSGKMVDKAIYMSIDDAPYEISLHASKIHKILCSVNINAESNKYINVAPNRFLLTLLAICTTVCEYGDKVLDDGQSMFIKNLGYLKDELRVELLKIKRNNFLFSGLAMVSVIPILFVKPIEWWAVDSMPELKGFYTGSYGTICMVLVFALALLCYTLITNLKDMSHKDIKEHLILQKLSSIRIISKVLTKETNRNYTKAMRINNKLKQTGEHMGYKQFLLKRILWAVTMGVIVQFLIVGASGQQKKFILNDFSSSFNSSFITDREYQETMRETAKMYANSKQLIKNDFDKDALVEDIVTNSPVTNRTYAEMVVDEIIKKLEESSNIYYRWYYLFVVFAGVLLGYNIPLIILNYSFKSMRMGMEDEVNQFQTIVLMLMHVDGMNIKTILEWMERFAYIFKDPISRCIIELPYGEEKALKKLRASEPFSPFIRFVNNLLSVNDQGIIASFEEIVSERVSNQEDRKVENEIISKKKSGRAAFICFIPIMFEIVCYLVYPMLQLANTFQSELDMSIH